MDLNKQVKYVFKICLSTIETMYVVFVNYLQKSGENKIYKNSPSKKYLQ